MLRFNQAIQRETELNFHVAYSNQAFELWFLLHYDYHNAAISRGHYIEKLTARLGTPYEKATEDMYTQLLCLQNDAIKNAKRLYGKYRPADPARDDPSTTVFLLVEQLNRFL